MGRRLEKYYLFCNTAFLSLFTMKFVQYIYTKYAVRWNKKAYKIYRQFPMYIGSFRYIFATKYTLSWTKQRLQINSEIFDLFCRLFCSYSQCICREVLQNK